MLYLYSYVAFGDFPHVESYSWNHILCELSALKIRQWLPWINSTWTRQYKSEDIKLCKHNILQNKSKLRKKKTREVIQFSIRWGHNRWCSVVIKPQRFLHVSFWIGFRWPRCCSIARYQNWIRFSRRMAELRCRYTPIQLSIASLQLMITQPDYISFHEGYSIFSNLNI